MKILAAYPLSRRLVRAGLGEQVVYRPELQGRPDALAATLADLRPDAVLIDGRDADSTGKWPRIDLQGTDRVYRYADRIGADRVCAERTGADRDAEQLSLTAGQGDEAADIAALALAERRAARRAAAERLESSGIDPEAVSAPGRPLTGRRVILVGAGIVNLTVAFELLQQGAAVEIVDGAPDPRTRPHWRRLGTTHGGGDGRMATFTEADNYNDKGLVDERGRPFGPGPDRVLHRTLSDGGWLAIDPRDLRPGESTWIQRFDGLPAWQAEVFRKDIYAVSKAAFDRWQAWQRDHPELFDGVGLAPGVLRLYGDGKKGDASRDLHAGLGSWVESLSADELLRRHPACGPAHAAGHIARAFEVRGFTLQIQAFCDRLLGALEKAGARFRWQCSVAELCFSEGAVSGLRTVQGEVLEADDYVISPGVETGELLAGTRSADKIQGVLGLWLTLPNPAPRLERSIKIQRPGHVGGDANVILGSDERGRRVLRLGSGYGFVGRRGFDMDSPRVEPLFEALEETARRYVPAAFEAAVRDGSLRAGRRACVRPFTATGLGIFEVLPASRGRLIVAAGHNTGGFTQAPEVAYGVAETLQGRSHPMQWLYDPERGLVPDNVLD